jgi:SAM-dependent methyltransferase
VRRGGLTRASQAAAYGALSALFYDIDKPRPGDEELAWYLDRLPAGSTVLEAMAGSGRLLLPLVLRGLRAHGVDRSPAMLARCTEKLRAAGCEPRLFRQDLEALNLPFRYTAAFIAAGSFQLLTEARAVHEALRRLRAHLVAPAVLLLDLFVPDAALHPPGAPAVEVRNVELADGSQLVLRSETRCDPGQRCIVVASRYERRRGNTIEAREDECLEYTWYDEEQITTLLRDAGYSTVEIEPPAWPRPGGRHFGVRAKA